MRQQIAQALIYGLAKTLPPDTVYRLAEPISAAFLRGKEKRLRTDVARVFPDKSADWVDDIVRRQRIHRAWVAIDKVVFPRLTADEIIARTDPASIAAARAVCDAALARGNGGIIYSLHFGRPTLSPIVLANLGYPYVALRAAEAGSTIDTDLRDHVKKAGIEEVNASDLTSGVQAMRALKRNKLFFALIDGQVTERPTMVEFFGQKVPISLGFAMLARRTGAALIAGLTFSDGPLAFRMVPKAVELPGDDITPEELGALLMRPLEEAVRQDPGQWYGVNRMFRKARKAAAG